ncbi:hypothetical protein LQ327_30715 [Actinomycetospora endophytica]|uniref:Integral membrane protein n=1 Tax=Actinomycetospora endophytica TaxID=2291215 RepID=A0ABS8PIJ5_9PSEU|nr:hypothetical protein [Actinomycetospora endophytica]MCD2197752.1 hypothetical protein [Actinomycetospora endophytica]
MDVQLDLGLDETRIIAAWMLGSFLVVFLVTRAIVRMIRAGRGPFRNQAIGGVHIHHLVHGIVLMLVAGAGEFLYRPDGAWGIVLAVAFGAGAALTLDEFALWLHLDDVYWSEKGRLSVDAVLVVAAVGALLVLGANPFGAASEDNAPTVIAAAAVTLAFAVVAALKGRPALAVIGVVFVPAAVVGAIRLARPGSPWAKRRYREGSSKDVRARARYPEGRRTGWDAVVDAVGGVPR